MADTISLPGLGPTKKTTAYALGAGVVILGGITWYRSKNAGAAAVAPAADQTAASDQIDPATGFPFGSAEDTNALAAQQFAPSGGGASSGVDQGTSGSGGAPTGGTFTTNAQWAQAVEDYLANTVGSDPNVVGNALGKYITGQALTVDQVAVVEQAIAFGGYPPVNGPTGYPPSYKTVNEPPPPPPTSGTPKAAGTLHASVPPGGKTTVNLSWSVPQDQNRSATRIYDNIHPNHIAESTGTAITLHNQPVDRRKVTYHIRSVNSAGQIGPPSNYVTIGK